MKCAGQACACATGGSVKLPLVLPLSPLTMKPMESLVMEGDREEKLDMVPGQDGFVSKPEESANPCDWLVCWSIGRMLRSRATSFGMGDKGPDMAPSRAKKDVWLVEKAAEYS